MMGRATEPASRSKRARCSGGVMGGRERVAFQKELNRCQEKVTYKRERKDAA